MLICYCSLHQETWKSAKRWRQLDNPKVRPKVLKFFPIHFFRRWLNPHISYQLSVGWGWKLTIMHVAVYIFWLSNLWTNKASDYRNTIRKKASHRCIWSSSFRRARNCESRRISRIVPFISFLYLCTNLCFSSDSLLPPVLFFRPSKLRKKTQNTVLAQIV